MPLLKSYVPRSMALHGQGWLLYIPIPHWAAVLVSPTTPAAIDSFHCLPNLLPAGRPLLWSIWHLRGPLRHYRYSHFRPGIADQGTQRPLLRMISILGKVQPCPPDAAGGVVLVPIRCGLLFFLHLHRLVLQLPAGEIDLLSLVNAINLSAPHAAAPPFCKVWGGGCPSCQKLFDFYFSFRYNPPCTNRFRKDAVRNEQ